MSEMIGLAGLGTLLLLIALRAPIGLALLFVGLGGIAILHGSSTMVYIAASAPEHVLYSYTLTVLPLFLLMGSIAVRSGLATALYTSANAFAGHYRGGLSSATIFASGGFGAVCGSSLATVTTVAKISIPQMLRFGYSPQLAAGSVAAGGTLGILIPPSLLMILYAYLTETSVGKLFAAGIVPGILAVTLYCATIAIWTMLRPQDGPVQKRHSWRERLASIKEVGGVLLAFLLIMGGIFAGWFSPTEGAGVGAALLLIVAVVSGRLDWVGFVEALQDTIATTAMIFLILIGVETFQFFMEASRLPDAIVDFLTGLQFAPWVVLAILIGILILLGCILDSIAIVLIMTPFLYPIVQDLGYDLIWFGIVMVMVVEIGLLTPPFGINVFVIRSVVPEISLKQAFIGVFPFVAADIVRVGIILAFPVICLWLPSIILN